TLAALVDNHNSGEHAHLRLWDTTTRKELARFRCRSASGANSVGFTPDGKALLCFCTRGVAVPRASAAVSEGGDFKRPGPLQALELPPRRGRRGALCPDGKTLVVGGFGLALYDLQTGNELAPLDGRQVYDLAVSRDGRWLASSHPGGKVTAWDLKGRNHLWTASAHEGKSGSVVAFSPDGAEVASAGGDARLVILSRDKGAVRSTFDFSSHRLTHNPYGVSFTPDGKTLVVAGLGVGVGIYLWE